LPNVAVDYVEEREDGRVVGCDAVELAWRTPAPDLLDHSLLGSPQAADVIPLCLNG
jgi:hypothetical protein